MMNISFEYNSQYLICKNELYLYMYYEIEP